MRRQHHIIRLFNAELVEVQISEAATCICTGSEAAGLMRLCEQHLGELQWFGQGIEALGWSGEGRKLFASDPPADLINFGPTAIAAPCVEHVSQFLDAAFFCTQMPPTRPPLGIEWDQHTSKPLFGADVLAVLDLHDTSFIEVSTREDALARTLRSVVDRVRAR